MSSTQNLIIQKNLNLINYLIKILNSKVGSKIDLKVVQNTIVIYTTNDNLKFLLNFLKNHYLLQYKTLIGLTAVDYPTKPDRFEVNYFLLSYKLNSRLNIKITTDDINPIHSISEIYSSAN